MNSHLIFFFITIFLITPGQSLASHSTKESRDQLKLRIQQKDFPGVEYEEPLEVQGAEKKKFKTPVKKPASVENEGSEE